MQALLILRFLYQLYFYFDQKDTTTTIIIRCLLSSSGRRSHFYSIIHFGKVHHAVNLNFFKSLIGIS